jgi:hypothetical protein
MTSEKRIDVTTEQQKENAGCGALLLPVQYKREFKQGQVVQLQMSAKPCKGVLTPVVEVLQLARNASLCTQHISDPVMSLTSQATRSTRQHNFTCSSFTEYHRAWMPLLEMEAAVGACDCDGGVIIDNVRVVFKSEKTSSGGAIFKGSAKLSAAFCFNRCIELGGKSVESIQQEAIQSERAFPLDYLCLRYTCKTEPSDSLVRSGLLKKSTLSETADSHHYTWLAHASLVNVAHRRRKTTEGTLEITFILSPSSPLPPPELVSGNGDKLTLEILPKSQLDRSVVF